MSDKCNTWYMAEATYKQQADFQGADHEGHCIEILKTAYDSFEQRIVKLEAKLSHKLPDPSDEREVFCQCEKCVRALYAESKRLKREMSNKAINIIFDGPPSHESGRFVEVETDDGKSISAGEWIERSDGYWALRITSLPQQEARDG